MRNLLIASLSLTFAFGVFAKNAQAARQFRLYCKPTGVYSTVSDAPMEFLFVSPLERGPDVGDFVSIAMGPQGTGYDSLANQMDKKNTYDIVDQNQDGSFALEFYKGPPEYTSESSLNWVVTGFSTKYVKYRNNQYGATVPVVCQWM